ncbi:hypothetical protein Q5424_01225 [Conexibacter sp. JD483]|uniref:hypothetical protein n=1 Tax=unclassified Conexibacter TaxID=2627773 RepID=UPI0027232309|nr:MULTISPECIES: hypothetical protein [unclassified Conexibacter]MDO8185850.1 hypothetical protein [Conexibacter sp. CPCC 205706]MDO8198594.1 hypothetical protein [Conexibacter sp. CPCC 205762]MDR9367680.1 hypothetical protein [Conexibacter sp. JD483]
MSATTPFDLFYELATDGVGRARKQLFSDRSPLPRLRALAAAADGLAWRAAWLQREHRPHLADAEREWEQVLRILLVRLGAVNTPRTAAVIEHLDHLEPQWREKKLEDIFVNAVAALDVLSAPLPPNLDPVSMADLALKLTDVAAEQAYARAHAPSPDIGPAAPGGAR